MSAIMQALNYVGVRRWNVLSRRMPVNHELKPRVHNSGHWTQNGAPASVSLNSICATHLPPFAPVINAPSVMINLIGSEPELRLAEAAAAICTGMIKRYVQRKVGHLNLTDSDTSRLSATRSALPLLPGEYASGIIWAQSV